MESPNNRGENNPIRLLMPLIKCPLSRMGYIFLRHQPNWPHRSALNITSYWLLSNIWWYGHISKCNIYLHHEKQKKTWCVAREFIYTEQCLWYQKVLAYYQKGKVNIHISQTHILQPITVTTCKLNSATNGMGVTIHLLLSEVIAQQNSYLTLLKCPRT